MSSRAEVLRRSRPAPGLDPRLEVELHLRAGLGIFDGLVVVAQARGDHPHPSAERRRRGIGEEQAFSFADELGSGPLRQEPFGLRHGAVGQDAFLGELALRVEAVGSGHAEARAPGVLVEQAQVPVEGIDRLRLADSSTGPHTRRLRGGERSLGGPAGGDLARGRAGAVGPPVGPFAGVLGGVVAHGFFHALHGVRHRGQPQTGLKSQPVPRGDEIGQRRKRRIVVETPLAGDRDGQHVVPIARLLDAADSLDALAVRRRTESSSLRRMSPARGGR